MKYSQVFIGDKRPTLGPGARAALKIGAAVGFDSGFPPNFGTTIWAAIPRMFPLGWMLELWGALDSGDTGRGLDIFWIYKERNA
jgi:hypothetical protein